jgi:hypothetical protein
MSPANRKAMGGGLHRSIDAAGAAGGCRGTPACGVVHRWAECQSHGALAFRDKPNRPPSGLTPIALIELDDITVDTIGIGADQAFLTSLGDNDIEAGGITRSAVNAEDLW